MVLFFFSIFNVGVQETLARETATDVVVNEDTTKVRDLQELVVKAKHQKYSKKNNPAVELMRRVREDGKKIKPEKMPYYSYDKYDKMVLAINDFGYDFEKSNGSLSNKMKFFSQYVDTASWTGSRILNISLKEKSSKVVAGDSIGRKTEIVEGLRSKGLDESFNQDNIRTVVEDIVREINLYGNDITLLQNRFVGPLSAIAADYYMYEITDTLLVNGEYCTELSFAPHTPESMGFNGKLYIAGDSLKYIRRATLRLPKAANVNYIENLFISQNNELDSIGKIHKMLDDVCIEFKIMPGTPKFYANRISIFSDFSYQNPDVKISAVDKGTEIVMPDAEHRPDSYWAEIRPIPMSRAQYAMGSMMSKLRSVPFFYWTEKVLGVLVNGYIKTGNPSKFDLGKVNQLISFNTAEGARLRVGGITTAALSPRWFGRGYVAYGTKDQKWKYSAEAEYSFIDKKYTSRDFPVNSIRATYSYDTDQIGQHYLFTNADNIFLSFKRMKSDLITYRRLGMLEYNLELRNNFSVGVALKNEIQEATQWIPFMKGNGTYDRNFNQSAVKLQLRFAPGEKFVDGPTTRLPVNLDAPVFLLTHEFGPKGFMGADFTLNKTELSIQKRIWFSAFGYLDAIAKGGIIWSKVQFPALLWQNANISYTIQPESYALLNPMEFAMDRFASIDLTYFTNGLIFNRIPLLKKLKLREVTSFKGFYGKLSNKNNPAYNEDLYRFPAAANTTTMGKKPYMEIGVGLDNIITILRVEYLWRLSYRDNPGIAKSGLRVALHFAF